MSAAAGPAGLWPGVSRLCAGIVRLGAAALTGAAFAFALHSVWDLDLRWLIIAIVGVLGVSLAMCLARVYAEVAFVGCLFAIPFASFNKWFWPSKYGEDERGNLVFAGLLSIGVLDFVLIGVYVCWVYRVFVQRHRVAPGLLACDGFIVAFFVAQLLSSIGSYEPILSFEASEYYAKYALFYFFVSRNLAPRHLPWLLAALGSIILIEGTIGVVQFSTGKLVGLALDKGAGGSDLNYQYAVPGIDTYKRATGTCYDSHSLGHLLAMVLPFPFVLSFTPGLNSGLRLSYAAAAAAAVGTIGITQSRSAWLAAAISIGFAIVLIVAVWQERQVVRSVLMALFLLAAVAPFGAGFVIDRFVNSPYGTLSTRFDQYEVALTISQLAPLLGFGAGNWIEALNHHDYLWLEVLPVHNVILWVLTETGVVGLACYLGIFGAATVRLARLIRSRSDLVGRLGLATLVALLASLLDGLTDPTFREPNAFLMFWLLIALAAALPQLPRTDFPQARLGPARRTLPALA